MPFRIPGAPALPLSGGYLRAVPGIFRSGHAVSGFPAEEKV